MSNKNAGNRYFDAGLVIQARPEIDTNEFGLTDATFSFLTSISNWPGIQPARGTPCNQFQYGDNPTHTFLVGVSFLGCQTARWKPARLSDPASPGTLEVHCQGANFSESIANRIQTIAIASGGSGYTTRPEILISGGGQVHAARVHTRLEVSTRAISAAGTGYVVGDSLTISGGAYDYPATIRVDSLSGSTIATCHVTNRGKYFTIPTNPAAVTGGTGTGATFTLTWRVGFIVVEDGGLYTSTPTATVQFGNAQLGTITMSSQNSNGTLQITTPWKPVSTTKDTVQFSIFGTVVSDPNATTQVKYATTNILGTGTPGQSSGYFTDPAGIIRLNQFGNLTPGDPPLSVDGSVLSVGDKILVKNETSAYRNGIYTVVTVGGTDSNGLVDYWRLRRSDSYDEATAFTTALLVEVQSGSTQAGTIWGCATNVTTLSPADGSAGDNITFNSTTNDPTTSTVPTARVTIDYHAIDLHFEYMANQKLQEPRFVLPSYSSDGNGYVITDPETREKQFLDIDSILVETITVDETTGNTQYTPTNVTASNFDWEANVRFLGTAARFEQTPAGQYWHIIETATIRIVPVGSSPT